MGSFICPHQVFRLAAAHHQEETVGGNPKDFLPDCYLEIWSVWPGAGVAVVSSSYSAAYNMLGKSYNLFVSILPLEWAKHFLSKRSHCTSVRGKKTKTIYMKGHTKVKNIGVTVDISYHAVTQLRMLCVHTQSPRNFVKWVLTHLCFTMRKLRHQIEQLCS